MPWPATVGLNQLSYGVIDALTNATSNFGFSVLLAGGTATVAAALNQTVIMAIAYPISSATLASGWSILVPGQDFQSAIATAGSMKQLVTTDWRNWGACFLLTPAAP